MPRVEQGQLTTYLFKYKADAIQAAAARGLAISTSAFVEILLHWGARALLQEVRLRPESVPPGTLEELITLQNAMDVLPHYGPVTPSFPSSEVVHARRMIEDLEG